MRQSFAFLVLILLLCSFCNGHYVVSVEKDGKALNFSAKELSYYLGKITGRQVSLSNNKRDSDIVLRVNSSLDCESYKVFDSWGKLYIEGGSERGCLYGVYELLKELGCRWPLPGDQYEIVPAVKNVKLSRIKLSGMPAMNGRGIFYIPYNYQGNDLVELIDFMAKNGFNFLAMHAGPLPDKAIDLLAEEIGKRNMNFEWGGHFLPKCLPRELFDKHPEYFRMEDGKRTKIYNFCPSSEKALDIIAQNATKEFKRYTKIPNLDMIHIWGDDIVEHGWCSCPKCKDYSASDQLLMTMNGMAKRMDLGDTKLAYLVYHATIYPPEKIKPRPEIRLLYAPRERCFKHRFTGCKSNRWYLDKLKGQLEVFGDDAEVFEYYHDNVMFRCMPYPMHTTIGNDIETYYNCGMKRLGSAYFQIFGNWAYGMNSYLLGKALWRGKGASEDMLEYCNAVYGPFGEDMLKYFGMINQLVGTAMQTCGYEPFIDLRVPPQQEYTSRHIYELSPLVTEYNLDEIDAFISGLIEKADEPYKNRISEQKILFDVARLQTRNVYRGLLIGEGINAVLQEDACDADKLYMKALLKKSIAANIETSEILLSAPENVRGPHINEKGGVVAGEMLGLYQGPLKHWLEEIDGN